MKTHNKSIGKMLATMRKYRNMTQNYVAVRLGTSRQYITNIETGQATVSMDRISDFCDIYDCALDIRLTPKENL